MHNEPHKKYKPFDFPSLPDRKWPNESITKAPIWCSVDLRDGNQALVNPMGKARKLEMFEMLLKSGFKEIEVGFPAASETDYSFLRHIIEENLIPDDVTIQILVQAREKLIDKTFEAIKGARKVIVHLYNSTSVLQRKVVFNASKKQITAIATKAARHIKNHAQNITDTKITYQYSPESFTGTEIEYAAEICDAVCEVYQPTLANKIIINLPATIEMHTPNIFADQVELFCRLFKYRPQSIISLHTHNDRGTGIAASELGILAGGERIEGTLFGNGERTGNLDIVTMALNMYSHGVSPNLDFSQIKKLRAMVEHCTGLKVHERHPYAGDLVFTAFSGSHQDAIKKGFECLKEQKQNNHFQVPYFIIDPADIGRRYDPFIRVNSQSGKAGSAYLIQAHLGFKMPRNLQIEFSEIVQKVTEQTEKEIDIQQLCKLFEKTYLLLEGPLKYQSHNAMTRKSNEKHEEYRFNIIYQGSPHSLVGRGRGPLECFIDALQNSFGLRYEIMDYLEHSISSGSDSYAAAYVQICQKGEQDSKDESNKNRSTHATTHGIARGTTHGIGKDRSITKASLHAIVCAVNRHLLAN